MKIYTKTGDQGETGLLGGVRVRKDHEYIEICGELDELNSALGVVLSSEIVSEVGNVLIRVQSDLFDLGGQVAAALGSNRQSSSLDASRIVELEQEIDSIQNQLEPMTAFIMPGGSPGGSQVHWARTVCRRVERRFVSLVREDIESDFSRGLIFLNRLSDYLFVAARYINKCDGQAESHWVPNKPAK